MMNSYLSGHRNVSVTVLVATAVTYLVTGVLTLTYPPEYLSVPYVWGCMFIVAALVAFAFLVFREKWMAVLSGGIVVGAALFRSFAIWNEVVWGSDVIDFTGPLRSSYAIAGTTWALIAILLWAFWPVMSVRLLEERTDG